MHNWRGFYHDHQLKVYMYAFMYVDPETIPVEYNFKSTKSLLQTTRTCQIKDQYQNIGLDLVAYDHKIMIYIRYLMKQNTKTIRPHTQ